MIGAPVWFHDGAKPTLSRPTTTTASPLLSGSPATSVPGAGTSFAPESDAVSTTGAATWSEAAGGGAVAVSP